MKTFSRIRIPFQNLKSVSLFVFTFFYYPLLADVITKDFLNTTVNWTKLELSIPIKEKTPRIQISGTLEASTQFANNTTEARTIALNSAKEKISLLSVRGLEQLQFNNNYKIVDMINQNSKFRESFNEFILQENLEYKVKIQEDQVYVEAVTNFLGPTGLLNYLLQDYNTEQLPAISDEKFATPYTGLILDVRHLEAKAALFPKILTDKGLEIYSPKMVYKNLAIDNGYVKYYNNLELAIKDPKVGNKPYLLLAQSVLGKNKTDFAIPTQEAKKILAHKQTREHLKKCAVIILIDLK